MSEALEHSMDERIFRSIRRISRAVDLFSHQLARQHLITVPQLMCLRIIGSEEGIPPSKLAREVALSQATVTGILNRLEMRKLITRQRSFTDKRKVELFLTREGLRLLTDAPLPLQQNLAERFRVLEPSRQQGIATVLEQVVAMMEAQDLDAAPILTSGPIEVDAREMIEYLDPPIEENEFPRDST